MGEEVKGQESLNEWFKAPEGELSIDVFQTDSDVVVQSVIAGVESSDIDISVVNDLLTIRGKRTPEFAVPDENYFWKECFWGNFSRSVILPVDVESSKIKAAIKNGVLTVKLPKAKKKRAIKVKTISENSEAEKNT